METSTAGGVAVKIRLIRRVEQHRAGHAVLAVWYRVLRKVNDRWLGKQHEGGAMVQASGTRMKPTLLSCCLRSFLRRKTGFRTWWIWLMMTSPFHVQSTWMLRLILDKGSISHSAAKHTGVLVRQEMLVRRGVLSIADWRTINHFTGKTRQDFLFLYRRPAPIRHYYVSCKKRLTATHPKLKVNPGNPPPS